VGGAVGGVSDATGLPLDSATGPITKPLDDALGGAANAAGAPQLGQTATGLTGTLLP
jgi:hypothetical protein